MEGTYRVQITTKRLQYDFTIRQKYTCIRGDSATGKTFLYRLLEMSRKGIVQVSCPAECLPASALGEDWSSWIQTTHDAILFFDDTEDFVTSAAFAEAAMHADNYFVFLSREPMERIPYSVRGVYAMKTSGAMHSLEPLYQEDHRPCQPNCIVTEGRISGTPFSPKFLDGKESARVTASGKSTLYKTMLSAAGKGEDVLVLADGGVLGSELDRLLSARDYMYPRMRLCLPESSGRLGLLDNVDFSRLYQDPPDGNQTAET